MTIRPLRLPIVKVEVKFTKMTEKHPGSQQANRQKSID